jgi:hypothetical protein
MLLDIDHNLKRCGLSQMALPDLPFKMSILMPVTSHCSMPILVSVDSSLHYTSEALCKLTKRMIIYFPHTHILEWFKTGLGPVILSILAAYVSL